jgi:hypothetical protein
MKLYSVYINPENSNAIELVEDGFSFIALAFNVFWSIYYKIWDLLLLLIVLNAVVMSFKIHPEAYRIASTLYLVLSFAIGVCASDIREFSLKKRGYELKDVVYAINKEVAYAKFISKN